MSRSNASNQIFDREIWFTSFVGGLTFIVFQIFIPAPIAGGIAVFVMFITPFRVKAVRSRHNIPSFSKEVTVASIWSLFTTVLIYAIQRLIS